MPVAAIFTKSDKVHTVALKELKREGKSLGEARDLAPAPERAKEKFKRDNYTGVLQEMHIFGRWGSSFNLTLYII